MSELINSLLERVSVPANLLQEPAPSDQDVRQMIQAAVCAPDHGGIRPWRFISIRGDARHQLGELFCQAALKNKPDLSQRELDDIRQKPLRSPLIIAVVAAVKEHPKVPAHEQIHSAAAAAQNLLLAAGALGYGAIWLTGPFATDPYVLQELGLTPAERLLAFIYMGSADETALNMARKKLRNRPNAADYIAAWGS